MNVPFSFCPEIDRTLFAIANAIKCRLTGRINETQTFLLRAPAIDLLVRSTMGLVDHLGILISSPTSFGRSVIAAAV
jgi:hypothetical protein